MAALAADRHSVTDAASKCLSQALFRVVLLARLLLQHRAAPGLERLEALEGFAALIENYRGEIGAEPNLADIGHQRAGQKIEQCRLAGTVGADDADPVAAQALIPRFLSQLRLARIRRHRCFCRRRLGSTLPSATRRPLVRLLTR
jgi:hypothetical protein